MRKMLPIYRPQGESRQSTIERLRRSLVPTNQIVNSDAVTIIDAPNLAGKTTQFKFIGPVEHEYMIGVIHDTFDWQATLRSAGVRLPRVAPNALTVKRNKQGQFKDGDKNKFRGADIKLGQPNQGQRQRSETGSDLASA